MKKEEIRIRVTPDNVNEFIEVLRRNGENVSSIMDPNPWWCIGFMFIKISDGFWHMYSTTLKNKQITDSPSFNWTPQDLEEFLNPDPFKVCIKVTADTIEKFRECLHKLGYQMFALAEDGYLLRAYDGSWTTVWETNGRRVVEWSPDELHSNILIKQHERSLESNKEKYDRLYEAQRILKEQNEFDRKIHAMHVHERPYVPDEHIRNQLKQPVFSGQLHNWTDGKHLRDQLKTCHVVKNADGTTSSVTLRDDKAVVEMPNGTLRIVDKNNLFKFTS